MRKEKNFKAWVSDEGYTGEPKLIVAVRNPTDGLFNVKTIPSNLITELTPLTREGDGYMYMGITLGQGGDPYLAMNENAIKIGPFETKRDVTDALNSTQKALGMGGNRHRKMDRAIGAVAGMAATAVLAVLVNVFNVQPNLNVVSRGPVNEGSFLTGQVDTRPDEAYVVPEQITSELDKELNRFAAETLPGISVESVVGLLKESGSQTIKVGDDTPEFIVFSDPTCPSCAAFDELASTAKKNYIVVPVGVLSSNAAKVATKIMCADNKLAFYRDTFTNPDRPIETKDVAKIGECAGAALKNEALFRSLNVTSVPTLVNLKNNEVSRVPFPSIEALNTWLEAK